MGAGTESAAPEKKPLQSIGSSQVVGIFLQNACLQHRYIRSKNTSNIVERPERLRAVSIGLAAAIARLEEVTAATSNTGDSYGESREQFDIVAAMEQMKLKPGSSSTSAPLVSIVESSASVDLLTNPAVKFIHGDVDGDDYLKNLKVWAQDSWDKISKGESEIPENLSQGDLYLCPESTAAMEGALGTVCEAVDKVITSGRESEPSTKAITRGFVAIRPPGHHCGEDTPSGFCFLNNVAVAAAHAHLQHQINRIVIFDIDLHHGNGTQSIVWQINEETYRQTLESEGGGQNSKSGLKVYYGSIHDILSFPCEDGKPELVQAASVSIHKSHGQYIENIHLQKYHSEEHFWEILYRERYSQLIQKAEDFLNDTGGPGDDTLVFISCGMDACEHEYESMSRHDRKVPTSFYYQFARDACAFSDKYCQGRLISVLEGGYSDRALISGSMAHLLGLANVASPEIIKKDWWNIDNLTKLEQATKKRRGGRPSVPTAGSVEPWIEKTLATLASIDTPTKSVSARSLVPPPSMKLRDKSRSTTPSPAPTQQQKKQTKAVAKNPQSSDTDAKLEVTNDESPLSSPSSTEAESISTAKKLPRVILRLGKPPDVS